MAGHIIYTHRTIPATPETVWSVITDVASAGDFMRSVSDVEPPAESEYDVGTTWRARRHVFGHRDVEEFRVVECEAPRKAVVEAVAGHDTIRTSYRLTPMGADGDQTRLAMTTTIKMSQRTALSRAMWAVFGSHSFEHTRKVLEHDLEDIEAEAMRRSSYSGQHAA